MSELKLRDDILDELAYEPVVDAARIGVAVDENVVTLTGHVGSYAQKLAALSAVRRVKGVRGIADEIEVRTPADAKTSDDEIARRAISVVSWDSVVPSEAIQVTVRDGLVTLTGKVTGTIKRAVPSATSGSCRGCAASSTTSKSSRTRSPTTSRRRSKRP